MRVGLTGRHVEVTPTLRRLVDRRLSKLDRIFGAVLVSGQIVLSREKGRCVVELVVHTRGDHMLPGTGRGASWGPALTAAVAKVTQQGKKITGKWQQRKRRAKPAGAELARRRATVARAATPRPRR
jgi:ribosomal subunit interface protein